MQEDIELKDNGQDNALVYRSVRLRRLTAFFFAMLLILLPGCSRKDDTAAREIIFEHTSDYVETVSEADIYVRPDESSDIYTSLLGGVDLKRSGTGGGWSRVEMNGGSYFVRSELVRETDIKWATPSEAAMKNYSVFIDPAKQNIISDETEKTAPSSEQEKASMGRSHIGTSSGSFEYEVNLLVARELKAELEGRGYTVYMSRESNNVNISNSQRAYMANSSGADIYIRISTGYASDEFTSGTLGMCNSPYNIDTSENYEKSHRLCSDIINSMTDYGKDYKLIGLYETNDLTSLNYCTIPACDIYVGFISNKDDDIALAGQDYRSKLVSRMADGIDKYFKED